jgi:hypothetical protein
MFIADFLIHHDYYFSTIIKGLCKMNYLHQFKKTAFCLAISLLSMTSMAQTITNFTVVNADTDADIATFTTSGSVLQANTPNINVRANVAGAVKVVFTQGTYTKSETTVPLSFKGDVNGNYNVWAPTPGIYNITATPYSSTNVAGPAMTLVLTVVAPVVVPPTTSVYNYQVILGHDGHADRDDNSAALAGYVAAKRMNDTAGSRVQLQSMIYGDTTEARQNGMLGGVSGTTTTEDDKSVGNYAFFNQYTKPALQSMGFGVFFDLVPQTFNFNTTALTAMTTGGRHISEKVRDAIGSMTRVVYSAGGGNNAGAEAIAWLRTQGYSDVQIKNHFAIVQHSTWNWGSATEAVAKTISEPFTIRIENQNPYAGLGAGVPLTVSAARTSTTFANAWAVAVGSTTVSTIPNFAGKRDSSDAGSHFFCSTAAKLDTHWGQRGNVGKAALAVPYTDYTPTVMNQHMN